MIGVSLAQGVFVSPLDREILNPELVRCFRHEGEDCPSCDGSGYRLRKYCTGCGQLACRPSQGGKALMGLRNQRGRNQPFYCLHCHPELGHGSAVREEIGG